MIPGIPQADSQQLLELISTHPNFRYARSITGWRWSRSICGNGLQINANDGVALKAFAADQHIFNMSSTSARPLKSASMLKSRA